MKIRVSDSVSSSTIVHHNPKLTACMYWEEKKHTHLRNNVTAFYLSHCTMMMMQATIIPEKKSRCSTRYTIFSNLSSLLN